MEGGLFGKSNMADKERFFSKKKIKKGIQECKESVNMEIGGKKENVSVAGMCKSAMK